MLITEPFVRSQGILINSNTNVVPCGFVRSRVRAPTHRSSHLDGSTCSSFLFHLYAKQSFHASVESLYGEGVTLLSEDIRRVVPTLFAPFLSIFVC